MAAKQVKLQPKQQAPKVDQNRATGQYMENLAAFKSLEAQQLQAQREAAGEQLSPEAIPLEGPFPDPIDVVHEMLPQQVADAVQSITPPPPPKIDPAAVVAKYVKSQIPHSAGERAVNGELAPPAATAAVSAVDMQAGIPAPEAPAQVVDSQRETKIIQPQRLPSPTPPATRAAWLQQQRGEQVAYPDITDIVAGRIPGEKMLNNPLDLIKKVAPPPTVIQQVVVKHEPPPEEMAYVLTRKFVGFLGDSLVELEKDTIIYEPYVVEELLRGGFDGVQEVKVAQQAEFITCPCGCNHSFPLSAARR